MKNIQVIDGALNCTYSIYSINEDDFIKIFPSNSDVEFIDDFIDRVGENESSQVLSKLWKHQINKKKVNGIHGTLYYELDHTKKYYPTKKENEMVVSLD